MKHLRSQGYEVIVEPDNSAPIYMLTQKGFGDLIPTFIDFVGNLSVGVLGSLIATYFSKNAIDREEVVIEKEEDGVLVRYTIEGEKISQEDINKVSRSVGEIIKNFGESLSITSPYDDAPHPLYLEHTGVVIGWCDVKSDEKGLLIDSARITNEETNKQIKAGVLQGFSIGGLVKRPTCTVCMENYIHCEHMSGKSYHGVKCVTQLVEIDLAEISIVKEPVNSLANIKFK